MTDRDFSLSANVAGLKAVGKLEDALTEAWYSTTLKYKLTGSATATSLTPNYWLSTSLYQAMRSIFISASKVLHGMTFVYFGGRRTGKTFAALGAMQLFLNGVRGKMPAVLVNWSGSLSLSFRSCLGTPDTMSDRAMLAHLFEQLGNHELNKLLWTPPVVFIDGLSQLSREDYNFIMTIYRMAYDSRVLLFVLSDTEETANLLCAMNGKARIQPITGMFDSETDWSIRPTSEHPFAGVIAEDIKWKPNNWTRKKLTKLVYCRMKEYSFDFSDYLDEEGAYSFIEQGDSPDNVLDKASQMVASELPNDPDAPTNTFSDPMNNENDELEA